MSWVLSETLFQRHEHESLYVRIFYILLTLYQEKQDLYLVPKRVLPGPVYLVWKQPEPVTSLNLTASPG